MQAVSIPGLTMGNEGSESLTDAEAVNRIMETIHRVTKEFREAETKAKLKDCQGTRVRSYQHQGNYIAGDKVWYQYKDGNACLGPGEVIYQKGNAVFVYSNGDLKKVAACKVKPYDLKERIDEEKEADKLGTNERVAPLGSVWPVERRPKAVVQSNVPGDDELAATDENGTNEIAAPEMISKAVVQSIMPDEKNKDNETEIEEIEDEN